MSCTIERGNPLFAVTYVTSTTDLLCATHQLHDNIGLRVPGYGTAEVHIDFSEELKHTDANPMCSSQ